MSHAGADLHDPPIKLSHFKIIEQNISYASPYRRDELRSALPDVVNQSAPSILAWKIKIPRTPSRNPSPSTIHPIIPPVIHDFESSGQKVVRFADREYLFNSAAIAEKWQNRIASSPPPPVFIVERSTLQSGKGYNSAYMLYTGSGDPRVYEGNKSISRLVQDLWETDSYKLNGRQEIVFSGNGSAQDFEAAYLNMAFSSLKDDIVIRNSINNYEDLPNFGRKILNPDIGDVKIRRVNGAYIAEQVISGITLRVIGPTTVAVANLFAALREVLREFGLLPSILHPAAQNKLNPREKEALVAALQEKAESELSQLFSDPAHPRADNVGLKIEAQISDELYSWEVSSLVPCGRAEQFAKRVSYERVRPSL